MDDGHRRTDRPGLDNKRRSTHLVRRRKSRRGLQDLGPRGSLRLVRLVVAFLLLVSAPAAADVGKVTTDRQSIVANGRAFGPGGAYEKLAGSIEFVLDPDDPRNAGIVDLQRAIRG